MSEPSKPSGIKPPSKIGRLCASQVPKPAVPPSPSRANSSVVLTEDTDSFIIGDRVWVGGNKPGIIAYIGETQFAPGDWAGVVLDQPIGKNDGSVANIRYFQCEPRKGIFSRLTRLTRLPLPEGGDLSFAVDSNTSLAHQPTSPSSTVSRPPSSASGRELKVGDRVIVRSTTGSKIGVLRYMGKTEFAPGEWCGVECDDAVGKNDGSVEGHRYFTCEPKHGLFAPTSKVSLSVSPRRPSCAVHPPGPQRQNTKDSITSTASSRVSSVARKLTRPATISKPAADANSSEVETIKSVNKAAFTVLKEKEMYIEQLLKERDMERLAVIRAASQAEEAERQQDRLTQELRVAKEKWEMAEADLHHQVAELTREKRDLANEMEDHHNKLEDISFRFEEERLARAELEAGNKLLNERITQLTTQLAEEIKRSEAEEESSSRLFEAEESLTNLRTALDEKQTELSALSVQMQELKAAFDVCTKECEQTKTLLREEQVHSSRLKDLNEEGKKMRREMEEKLDTYITTKENLEIDVTNLKSQLTESESKEKEIENICVALKLKLEEYENSFKKDKDSLAEELKTLSEKCKSLEDENNNKTCNMSALNLNVTQLESKLKSKEEEIDKLKEESSEELASLKSNIIDLQNKLSSISVDFESKEEVLQMQINDLKQDLLQAKKEVEDKEEKIQTSIKDSQKQLSTWEDNIKEKDKKFECLKSEYENKIEEIKNQFEIQSQALKESLVKSKKETEEKDEKIHAVIEDSQKQIFNMENSIKEKDKELAHLKNEYENKIEELKKQFEVQSQALKESLLKSKKEIEEKDEKINAIIGDSQKKISTLEDNIKQKDKDLSHLKSVYENKIEEFKNQFEAQSEAYNSLKDKNDNERVAQLAMQLTESSSKLFKAEESLTNLQTALDGKQVELSTVSSQMKELKAEFDVCNKECVQTKTLLKEEKVHSSKLKDLNEESQKMRKEIEEKLDTYISMKENLETDVATLKSQLTETQSREKEIENNCVMLKLKLEEYENSLKKDKDSLAEELKTLSEKCKSLEDENNNKTSNMSALNLNVTQLESKLKSKEEEIIKLKEESSGELASLKSNIIDLQNKLSSKNVDFESKEEGLQSHINNLKQDLLKSKKEADDKNEKIQAVIGESQKQISTLEDNIKEKDKALLQLKSEYENKIDEIKNQSEIQIQALKESMLKSKKESEEKDENIQSVIGDSQKQITTLEGIIKQKDKDLAHVKSEYENKIEDLEKQFEVQSQALKESLLKSKKEVDDKDENIQTVIGDLKKQISMLKDSVNQRDKALAHLKGEYENNVEDFKNKFEVQTQAFNVLKDKSDKEISENNLLLKELEELKISFKNNEVKHAEMVGLLESQKQTVVARDEEIVKLKIVNEDKTLQEELDKKEKVIARLQQNLETMSKAVQEVEVLKTEVYLVKEENKGLLKDLEKHRKANDLESQLRNIEDVNKRVEISSTNNNGPEEIDPHMQIDFLNSIIGDLQRKVEEQETVITQLKSGQVPMTTRVVREIAPRLFCDICDMFDLHDTDDCPRQAMDSPPPQQTHQPQPRGTQRPYCEACEMFGHDTSECDMEETY